MALYDKYYQTENYFGEIYPELLNYFTHLDKTLTVLDVGAGQGRDSLPIARLGFSVTAIDMSKVGIDQLNHIAKKENLSLNALVENMYSYDYSKDDIILMNSMFHFYKNDKEKETLFLEKIIDKLKKGSSLILIIQHQKKRLDYLLGKLKQNELTVTYKTQVEYVEHKAVFDLIVAKK